MSSAVQELPSSAQLMQMLLGKFVSRSIGVAAELGIADLLATGDKTVEELAASTSSHAPSLYRLMRALASVGVFVETGNGRFTLTPLADCLRSDAPSSLRNMARWLCGAPSGWRSWGELTYSVKTGETGLSKAYGGMEAFDYLKAHPEEAAIFNGAMTDFSRQAAPAIAETYPFSRFKKLVDIAGGHGLLLATILKQYPTLQGVLFDLPQVVEGASNTFAELGVGGRAEIIGGDFFQSIPSGADLYMMKHIIHDWDDERCITILRNIRRAMDLEGRLLVIEFVVPAGNEPHFAKWLDLEMLAMTSGGKERTPDEYRELLAAGGFKLVDIHSTKAPHSVIEGAPA